MPTKVLRSISHYDCTVTIDCAPDKQEIAPCIRDLMTTARLWIAFSAIVLFCNPVQAQNAAPAKPSPPKLAVNIEAQPIRDALKAFGEQTGLQILIRSEN